MTSRFQSIFNEASDLYRKNRFYDAAVTFEQARRIAKEYSLSREVGESGVWAAICWDHSSRPIKALNLLIEILSGFDTDLDVIDRSRARKKRFRITLCYSPELEKLQKLLENLKLFQQEHLQLPISDVHEDEASLLLAQGRWKDSLTKYELAWSRYKENEEGYAKFTKGFYSGLCNLYLGKSESAQYWCELLQGTDVKWPVSKCSYYILNTEIALYSNKSSEVENYATEAENAANLIQYAEFCYPARFLKIRSFLLQSSLGDPSQISNPARYRLRQRYIGKPDFQTKYGRATVLADYRLACIRYVLGIPPVDDRWYSQPQQIPTRLPTNFNKSDFQNRVQLADRSIRLAMRQASYLDDCFQCNWRQDEVRHRAERLKELINAVHSLG